MPKNIPKTLRLKLRWNIPSLLRLRYSSQRLILISVTTLSYNIPLPYLRNYWKIESNPLPSLYRDNDRTNLADLNFWSQSTSLDSGGTVSHQATGSSGATVVTRSAGRRWLLQSSQSSRQHSVEDGVRGGNVGVIGPVSTSSSSQAPAPALPPRRVSSAANSTDISNTATGSRGDR